MRWIVLALVLWSCENFAGPEGPAGSEGPVGPEGEQGLPGEDGVANITVIEFSVSNASFAINGDFASYSKPVSEITDQVMTGGMVSVYVGFGEWWYMLPMTYSYDFDSDGQSDWVVDYNYAYTTGFLSVYYQATLGSTINFSNPASTAYKVVVIPPTALAKGIPGEVLGSEIMSRVSD